MEERRDEKLVQQCITIDDEKSGTDVPKKLIVRNIIRVFFTIHKVMLRVLKYSKRNK